MLVLDQTSEVFVQKSSLAMQILISRVLVDASASSIGFAGTASAQYVPPNPGSCVSDFTYSAGFCVPRGGGGAMPTNRPGPAPAQAVSPIRPGCMFLGVNVVKSADLQGSEIDVSFQSTRLERTKLNLIVFWGGAVSLVLMTNRLGV